MGSGVAARAHRAEWLTSQRPYYPIPGPILEVQERDIQVKMRDGAFITVRTYSPEASRIPEGGSPLYVAYHEGGWKVHFRNLLCSVNLTVFLQVLRRFSR
jgi:hypothetical protein